MSVKKLDKLTQNIFNKTSHLRIIFGLIFLCGSNVHISGQSSHSNLRKGDFLYGLNDFKNAEIEYRQAEILEPSLKSAFNLGNTLYKQKRYEEAAKQYENAASKSKTSQNKADAYYNLGNAHYQNNNFGQSVDAYKKSLKINPEDQQAKHNLSLAKYKLQQQVRQQQNKDNNQDKSNDQSQNNDQPDNNNQKDQDNKNEQNSSKNNPSSKDDSSNMTKQEAEQLLKVAEEEERKAQQNLKAQPQKTGKPRKDW